ncbi:MAG: hypothetical protein A2987_02460 [Omnitrophica bacterium RIFCSPLOWO2_01_FULL_45_10]|nr:MAG: hypothetical protein A2987_02460 [Omnitrophica bacterium RIFCSPLOWO2_01_FULL_45_10]
MTIETVTGNLRACAQLEPGTFQDFDELSRDQIVDPRLLSQGCYVSTFPLYTARGGEPVLAFARHTKEHPNNLVLNHLFDKENSSYDQLIRTENFRPDPEEAQAVLEAADTLQVKLRDLRLSGNDKIYRFLAIRTTDGFVKNDDKYKRPSKVEKAVIQRVGYTEKFLTMLQRKCSTPTFSETRLYVLAPDYVAAKAGEKFIRRAAWRCDFFSYAFSSAIHYDVGDRGGLRGARQVVVPEGDAPQGV